MGFYLESELQALGFKEIGNDVKISKKTSIYNPGRIKIGSHVRIDDFCVLSAGEGGIEIGDYVHISVFCSLIGRGKIKMSEFSTLASRVAVYSSNDDYSGKHLIGPTVPSQFTGVIHADVLIGKCSNVGAGAIVLPGVVIDDGVAVGALSLVNKSCEAFGIYAGIPISKRGERKRELLELANKLIMEAKENQD